MHQLRWSKSSYSGSKDPTGPALMFTTAAWSAFIAGMKSGEFD